MLEILKPVTFDRDFWLEVFRKLGYPVKEEILNTEQLEQSGVIPRGVVERAERIYQDEHIDTAILKVRKLSRSLAVKIARNWKEKMLIRPLLIFTNERDSYVVIIPGPGTGGEARILGVSEFLYRTDVEAILSMKFTGDQESLKKAYDTSFLPYERVREEFFTRYRQLYEKIVKTVEGEIPEPSAYAQRFLGRLMFLYFLQRKGWLKGDRRFINKIRNYGELNKLFYEALNRKNGVEGIPFLNGSLFERERYLTEEVERKLHDEMSEIFAEARDFFNNYNFTVDETSPLEVEVSVDPLLLGTVLENMLPEHERGAKGTFYTPVNEISFICRRALVAWLGIEEKVVETPDGKLVFEDGLKKYVEGLKKRKSEREIREFKDKLLNMKVLDPAVGSGGFLVIMMQTILELLQEVDEAMGWKTDVEIYKKKILPNLYGFDLEPEAVEIARLRLWLSLVVDQKEPEPLPNLDMNIVTIQDSLYRLPVSERQAKLRENPEDYGVAFTLKEEIDSLKSKYLVEHELEKKDFLRKRIEVLCKEYFDKLGLRFSGKLPLEFFMPERADIIVMNPPYVRQEQIPKEKKEEYVAIYELDRKSDLYAYFMVRTMDLLKPNGVAVMITSDKWLEAEYGESLQEKLKPYLLAIYGQKNRSFQADINTVITVLKNERLPCDKPVEFVYLEKYGGDRVINYRRVDREELKPGKWYYLRVPRIFEEELLPKLTHQLRDFAEIRRGFTTGANEFFYMKDVTHLYEADYLSNPKKFEELGVKAKTGRELEEQGLIYIENEGGERFVIDRKDVMPVFRTPRNVDSWIIDEPKDLVLYTDSPGPFTSKYIEEGERKEVEVKKGSKKGKKIVGYNNLETTRSRKPWFSLRNELAPTHLILVKFVQKRHFEVFSRKPILSSNIANQLYLKNCPEDPSEAQRKYLSLWLYLNSTLFYLTKEIFGMRMGGGVLCVPTKLFANLPVPDLEKLRIDFDAEKLMNRKPLPYYEEVKQPDRKELDKAVLRALGFPEKDIDKLVDELHKAFVEVVEDRLIKADRPLGEASEKEAQENLDARKKGRRAK